MFLLLTFNIPFTSVSSFDFERVNVSLVQVSIEADGLEAQHALTVMFLLNQIHYLSMGKLPIIYWHKLKLR